MGGNRLLKGFFSRCGLWKPLIFGMSGVIATLLIPSCARFSPTPPAPSSGEERPLPPRFSIICVIHGDGDYLYHDSQGNALRADEEVFRTMSGIAARSPWAEVFIFHRKPRTRVWMIFPRSANLASIYRNGALIAEKPYRTGGKTACLDPEVELYRRFRSVATPVPQTVFLFFGHEIPEFDGRGYDASHPDRTFTIRDLAEGIGKISGDSTRIDLAVLSTCYGGTPRTIAALSPHARYIIASPENLHLSHFDVRILEHLDRIAGDGDISPFAREFARQAFDRLSGEVQTAVTVAVYDADRVRAYLREVGSAYSRALESLRGISPAELEHCDCAGDSTFLRPGMSEGVEVFYRPARFGRLRDKTAHSGWECWKRRGVDP